MAAGLFFISLNVKIAKKQSLLVEISNKNAFLPE